MPSVISAHYGLGQEVGLNGTPAIVLEDGTLDRRLSAAERSSACACSHLKPLNYSSRIIQDLERRSS